MERNTFIFYKSFLDSINELTDDLQFELFKAIANYGIYGEIQSDASPVCKALMVSFKPVIDSANKSYDTKVENGRRGGRPKKSEHQQEIENRNETEKNRIKTEKNRTITENNLTETEKNRKKPNHNRSESEKNIRNKDKDKDKDIDKDMDKDDDVDKDVDKDKDDDKDICYKLGAASATRKPEAVFIQIPLNDGSYHHVYESDVTAYQELYPATNAEQVFRDITGWNRANPKKRKTKRGINAHINSWFQREQDRPHIDKKEKKSSNPFAELAGMI